MKKTNKNYQRLSIFFLMILGMFIVSCKNPLNLKHNSKDAKKAYIRISTNLSDSKVRSVLPESFYDSEKEDTKSGLIWELSGEGPNESSLKKIWEDDSATETTAYKQMLGDTSIELDVGTWTFTLTAYVKNSDGIQEKVLESTIQKTIVSGQNSLSFEMEEAVGDEGVANGEISFTLNFPQNQVNNLAITLYNYPAQDGKYIPLGNQANQEISNNVSSYTCEYSDIKPGNYLLAIALQQETGLDLENNLPSYTTINTYTCVIHVAPGLKSVGSFNLSRLAELYQISYKYIDGETEVDAQFYETVTTSYNKYQTFTLPTPRRDGYAFKGWYETVDCSGTKVTSYKIPDDFNGTEIVFYADWEEVYITNFSHNIVKEFSDGINLETINSSDNTSYGKITNSNYSNEEDIWNKYLRLNDGSFQTGANYSVSIALKAEDTTVVAISAARADMYFTVTDEWQEYTFETGFIETDLVENVNAISMGVAKSETLFIANIKITKIIDENGNSVDNGFPTLSFNLANSAIDYYLQNHPKDENNCLKPIICVEKDSINYGYKVTINTKENDSNSNNDSINLTLRDYAIPGINMASFVLDSTCKSSIQGYPVTNLDGNDNPTKNETKSLSENINIWSNSSEKDNENYQYVVIPVPKTGENNSVPCSIEGFVKEVSEENSEITIEIKDYSVIKEINSLENTDKKFAVRVGDVWTKYSDFSKPIDITSPNGTELQVVLTDNNWDTWDWNKNDYYCQFKTYNKVDDDGGLTVEPKNEDSCTVSGAEKIKLSLAGDFTVLIEKVTDTNNDQPAGGELGLVYDNTNPSSGKLRIDSEQGLNLYRDIVNGTLTQDLNIPYMDGTSTHPISKNQTYALEALLKSNITVSDWIPIGTADHPFTSSFDGQGHSITINSMSSDAGEYAGVFGYVQGYSEPKTISNLVVKGAIQSSSDGYVGGIVAYAQGVIVENCVNMAELNSGKYVGGIIGFVGGGKASSRNQVSKCINAGSIRKTTKNNDYSGGIVAHTTQIMTISDCINLIDLTSGGIGNICGIVDVENTNFSPTVSVNNCINVGNILVSTPYAIASTNATINNCYYDSDKWTGGNTPNDNITPKTTGELTNGVVLDDSFGDNWSFAKGRYPLPNVEEVFSKFIGENGKTVWQEIVEAADFEYPTITNENISSIVAEWQSGGEFTYNVAEDITLSTSITIPSNSKVTFLAASKDVEITQASSGYLFEVEGELTLGGGSCEMTLVGVNGNTEKMIYSKGAVNINENVVLTGSYASLGVIYLYSGTLNMAGGKITKNNSTAITLGMGGGKVTVNISGGEITSNTKNSEYYGSAIHVVNQAYYSATIDIFGNANISNNTNESGYTIYVADNGTEVKINSSDENNNATICGNTGKNGVIGSLISMDHLNLVINRTNINIEGNSPYIYTDPILEIGG